MKNSVLLIIVIFFAFGCKKDETVPDSTPSNKELLCREWTLISINDTPVTWGEAYYIFKSDYDFTEINISYTNYDTSYMYGFWGFEDNESKIIIDFETFFNGTDTSELDLDYDISILSLNQNELIMFFNIYNDTVICN